MAEIVAMVVGALIVLLVISAVWWWRGRRRIRRRLDEPPVWFPRGNTVEEELDEAEGYGYLGKHMAVVDSETGHFNLGIDMEPEEFDPDDLTKGGSFSEPVPAPIDLDDESRGSVVPHYETETEQMAEAVAKELGMTD